MMLNRKKTDDTWDDEKEFEVEDDDTEQDGNDGNDIENNRGWMM